MVVRERRGKWKGRMLEGEIKRVKKRDVMPRCKKTGGKPNTPNGAGTTPAPKGTDYWVTVLCALPMSWHAGDEGAKWGQAKNATRNPGDWSQETCS